MAEKRAKPVARIGLIGAGFMGKCHANAFRSVAGLFDLPVEPELRLLADIDEAMARRSADALGFSRSTGDWRQLAGDPEIDIVAITAPNALHADMAFAAIDAGKAVYCEKPLSVDIPSARAMRDAALAAGTCTMVGFAYLRNPMLRLAHEIIVGGELGEVVSFRGIHAEDYMADPTTPHSFRTDPAGGGALFDLGSHVVSLARYLLGPIVSVNGTMATIHPRRPVTAGSQESRPVDVDDRAVFLGEFESGVTGTFEANWAGAGRKMQLAFEVSGTRGALAFTQERMNELLLYPAEGVRGRRGFTRIEAGPDHPPYGNFCPAPGHQLGYNELKVIEVAELLDAFAGGPPAHPDFAEGYEVQRVIEAVQVSAAERGWVEVASL